MTTNFCKCTGSCGGSHPNGVCHAEEGATVRLSVHNPTLWRLASAIPLRDLKDWTNPRTITIGETGFCQRCEQMTIANKRERSRAKSYPEKKKTKKNQGGLF